MVAVVGIIFIVLTIVLNRAYAKFIKRRSLKYYNKTQDIEKSLTYLKGYNKFFIITFIMTLVTLIFGFYLVLREFIEESSKLLLFISFGCAFIVYLIIGLMINKILIQAEMELKGSKRNKLQERIILKFFGFYMFMYLLFLVTFINFIHMATDIYFVRYNLGFYLKIGIVLLGFVISLLMSINVKRVFQKIFMLKPFLNDEIEHFVHQINPNVKLYYFESNDLKMANAFTIEGKQQVIFISDYLVNNTSLNELKAFLSHELGHLKMKHLTKRSHFILFGYLFGIIIQYVTLSLFNGNTLLSALFTLIYLFIYYILLKNKLYQKHERLADAFMLEVGIEKEDAVNLLEKLSSLNYMPRKGAKGEQILKTHPSIENRINHLKSL